MGAERKSVVVQFYPRFKFYFLCFGYVNFMIMSLKQTTYRLRLLPVLCIVAKLRLRRFVTSETTSAELKLTVLHGRAGIRILSSTVQSKVSVTSE